MAGFNASGFSPQETTREFWHEFYSSSAAGCGAPVKPSRILPVISGKF
jgi:hypothetical protein